MFNGTNVLLFMYLSQTNKAYGKSENLDKIKVQLNFL